MAVISRCTSATAADITKANNTDALNLTTSWSSGTVPGSGDVAVWDTTVTTANTVTLGGSLAWQGIKLTSPGGNVAITGGDTLTLGGGGIDLAGSTVNLSIGTPVTLAANQVWRAATGRTITATGVISGTFGLEIGAVGNLTSVTSNTFLTTTAQTLFTNQSLSGLTATAGQLSGAWIANQPQSGSGYLLTNNGTTANYWLEIVQGGDTKGVQVELTQSGSNITARSLAAKYVSGSTTLPYDFNSGGTSAPVATSSGANGYGVSSNTLYFGSDTNGTVLLSGVNSYSGATTVTRGILTAGTASVAGVGGAFGLDSAVTLADAVFTSLNLAGFNTSIGSLAGGGSTGGNVTLGSAILTVGGNNTSTSYAGVISGSGGLAKVGTGNQTLTAANSYGGGTTITAGTLTVTNASGLGTGSVTLGSSATGSAATSLILNGGITFSQPVTISSQGNGTATLGDTNAGAIAKFTGGVTLNRDVTLSANATDRTDFTGGISGTGNVTISGANRVIFLTTANTYAGTTTILNGSRLQLGEGALTSTNFLPDDRTVTVNSGGTLNIAKGGSSETIGGLAGNGTVQAFFSNNTLVVGGGNQSASFGGVLQQTSATLSIIKTGTGTQTLTGANTYGGSTTISQGTILLSNASGLGTTGAITINDASTGANNTALLLDVSGGNIAFSRPITVATQGTGTTTIGVFASAGSRTSTFSGAITLQQKDVILSAPALGDRNDFTGGISGTGNVTITTASPSRILFSGNTANTYTGTTTITAGSTLQFSDGTSTTTNYLPDTTVLVANGTLNMARGSNSETIGGLSGSGTVQGHPGVNNVASAIVVDGGQSQIFSGVLGNGGASGATLSFTKSGTGTQTLSGNNTYTGATTVSAGTLVVGNGAGSGAIGSGAVTVSSGATFTINRGSATGQEWTNNFSGAGTLRIEGGQDPQFSGNNSSFTGPVIISGSGAQFRTRSANAWSGQSVVTISNGGIASVFSYVGNDDIKAGSLWGDGTVRLGALGDRDLYLGGNNLDATFTGAIVNDAGGSGSVIKNGTGTQTLSGSSGYGGGTTINAGMLVAANNSALGTGGITLGAGGTLRVAQGTTISNSLSFAGGGLERVSNQAIGTVADLVAGTALSPVTLAPSVVWTAQVVGTTFSDVLGLTNTAGTVQILQLTYDPLILGSTPTADLGLGWNTSGSWVNAIAGNTGSAGGSAVTNQNGSFTSLGITPTAAYLGSWGRDTTTNTVWAVVNHNSDFAVIVVPEPGAVSLVGAGLVGCLGLALRRVRRPGSQG